MQIYTLSSLLEAEEVLEGLSVWKSLLNDNFSFI